MLRIKICGLMDPEYAVAAARLGADMLGMVFAVSRRQVTQEQAREIAGAVAGGSGLTPLSPLRTGEEGHVAGSRPLLVGVFVNQPLEEVNRVADACRLDVIQLSGGETPAYCQGLNRPFIKALRLGPEDGAEEMGRRMDVYLGINPDTVFLLDTHLPGVYGGSGLTWDWERAVSLARRYSVLIAGGLTPQNVAPMVREVMPWGVDVSSGIETGGVKDTAKIGAFIESVRGVH